MGEKQILSITFLLLIVINSSWLGSCPQISVNFFTEEEREHVNTKILGVEAAYIYIGDDSDFITYASGGDGTKNSPYIIENYIITSYGVGIEIDYVSAWFRICNNTIHHAGSWGDCGIEISGASNGEIINNSIKNYQSGISYTWSQNNNISGNIISNVDFGCYLQNADNFNILSNTISNVEYAKAISLTDSNNNTIANNTISMCKGGINLGGTGNLFTNNSLSNITEAPVIELYHSDGNKITKNRISNVSNGIEASFSSNIEISKNNISHSKGVAVRVIGSPTNVKILENRITDSDYGIELHSPDSCEIIDNFVSENTELGIQIYEGNSLSLTGNLIANNNKSGLTVKSSGDFVINNNTIYANGEEGIYFVSNDNCTAVNNNISKNLCGIWLSGSENTITQNKVFDNIESGIIVEATGNDNSVRFNEFNGNNAGSFQAADNGTNNVFEYNHWSDWTDPDTDVDGIVDDPYSLEGESNNQDQYPLVNPPIELPRITSPSSRETLTGNVSISWTESEDSLGFSVMYNVSYSTDEETTWTLIAAKQTTTSTSWDTYTVSDGSNYILKVEAFSNGGLNTFFVSRTFTIDNIIPSIAIISPFTQTYTTSTFTVTLLGDATHYWYYIESVDNENQTWTANVDRTLPDGFYTLHVYANDSVGNITSIFVVFSIDTSLPTVAIDSPLTKTHATDTITISLSGDATHYWYYIESVDNENQTWTANVDRILPDGLYTLHAYGNDSAGNINKISRTFTIKIIAPTTTTTAIPTMTTPTTTVTTTITPTTTTTPPSTEPTTTEPPTLEVPSPGWNIQLLLIVFIPLLLLRKRKRRS